MRFLGIFWESGFRKTYILVIVSYSMQKTTIQITTDTLERLKMFKQHEKDSYDVVLNSLLDDAEDEALTDEEIEDIKIALENVKRGETISLEDLAKEMGITLR